MQEDKSTLHFCFGLLAVLLIVLLMLFLLEKHKSLAYWQEKAVDPSVIPYGTEVLIDGHVYIAEDCGGAVKGNVIDIFVEDERMEMYYTDVYVRKEK